MMLYTTIYIYLHIFPRRSKDATQTPCGDEEREREMHIHIYAHYIYYYDIYIYIYTC